MNWICDNPECRAPFALNANQRTRRRRHKSFRFYCQPACANGRYERHRRYTRAIPARMVPAGVRARQYGNAALRCKALAKQLVAELVLEETA